MSLYTGERNSSLAGIFGGNFSMQMEECLQTIFKSKGLTQNGVSKTSGINKGTLNRLLNGKQNAKFDDVLKLSNALGLTSGERELLFNTFFEELYGERDIAAVKLAINEFSSAYLNAADGMPQKGSDSCSEGGFLPNRRGIEEAIVSIVDDENASVYTNFSFTDRRLDDFFFEKAKSGSFELIHFVEKIQNGGELENLHTLIRSLRFMNLLQFPYIVNIWQTGEDSQLLPYFVLTEKAAVLYNDVCGFFTDDPRAIAHLSDTVRKMASSATRLGKKPTDIMEIKNLTASASVRTDGMITMCKYPCFAAHITREMMYAAAKDVPFKDRLIEICASHYETFFANAPKTQFSTLEGLENFAMTGNYYEIPGEFVHEFPSDIRITLLESMKQEIKDGTFFILTKPNALPEGVALECYSDKTMISGTDTSVENFGLGTQFRYAATDPFYVKLTRIIKEYLVAGQHVFSEEAAIRIIDNCITLAKNS